MATELSLRAIDGSLVTLSSTGDDLVPVVPATSIAAYLVDGGAVEYTTGTKRLGEEAAIKVSDIELTETLSYRGGTLRVGFGRPDGLNDWAIAVYEGAEFCLFTNTVNRTLDQVVALFEIGDLSEQSEGLVFSVATRERVREYQAPGVIQELQDLGVLAIGRTTDQTRAQLPPWQGTRVKSGELFVDEPRSIDGRTSYTAVYLINQQASARLTVGPDRDRDAAVNRLAGLSIGWSAS